MGYNNPTELLIAATALPAAIEAKLPEGAPKVSVTLVDIANKLPVVPDFPVELPDLPAVPEFPELPGPPGGNALRRPVISAVEVRTAQVVTPALGRQSTEYIMVNGERVPVSVT